MSEDNPQAADALGDRFWDLVADLPARPIPLDALLSGGRRARRIRVLTRTAAAAAVLAAGTGAFAIVASFAGHAAPAQQSSAASSSGPSRTPPLPPRTFDPGAPHSGPAHPALGTPYAFDLLTHCGIRYAHFDSRTWATATTLPEPTPSPDAHGTSTYTGYLAGYMTLVSVDQADFTTGASDFAPIVFHPATQIPPLCA